MEDKNKSYGWRDVLTYFRQFKVGHLFTRKEYLAWFGVKDLSSHPLADQYRVYLTKAGFLFKESYGAYKMLKRPPMELTSRECRRMAYPNYKRKS